MTDAASKAIDRLLSFYPFLDGKFHTKFIQRPEYFDPVLDQVNEILDTAPRMARALKLATDAMKQCGDAETLVRALAAIEEVFNDPK